MIRIKQCIECGETKKIKEFEITDGKRSGVCDDCLCSVPDDITIIKDTYEFTEKDFTDDEAEEAK